MDRSDFDPTQLVGVEKLCATGKGGAGRRREKAMNAGTAKTGEAGEAPREMGFGAEITVKREDGTTTTFREVVLVMDCPGPTYEDDSYRVEYMGISSADICLDRNDDGTWGKEHESAEAAGERLAGWLVRDAVLSVEEQE